MSRLGFVLVLCVYGALAYRVDYELEDMDRLWARGSPQTASSGGGGAAGCKKDIWILWDNSQSVGWKGFNERIRPFIKKLISSPLLNVGPEGTHIGIVTFATQDKTKVLLDIGAKQTESDLLSFLDSLNYERDLMGDGTRTGMAFKIADEKFWKENPKNYRPDVDDVVLMFTDGEPVRRRGEKTFGDVKYRSNRNGERLLAKDRADNLKNRGITVVGLAVGLESRISRFRADIQSWVTTPINKYYYEAKPEQLNSILEQLISASCIDPGKCGCHVNEVAPAYVANGGSASVTWLEPTLECFSGIDPIIDSKKVEPSVSSPANFGVGRHVVTYIFGYLRGPRVATLRCPVEIDVEDCGCPSSAHVEAELRPGQNEASVSWEVPKPNCPATLKSVSRPGARTGRGRFPIGDHSVTYEYEHSSRTGSFSLRCSVSISVQGVLCAGVAFDPSAQECCCGTIFDRQANHACCGPKYYDTRYQTCKDFYTLDALA